MSDPIPEPDRAAVARNLISGRTKTWIFGERKSIRVVEIDVPVEQAFGDGHQKAIRPEFRDTKVIIATEVDHPTVGHVLLGCDHALTPEKDQCYRMEFTKGGPLGGYWRIIEAIPPA